MKIYAPVKNTNGVYASVRFVNGVGETDNPLLIAWFRSHGYKVPIEDSVEKCEESSNVEIDTVDSDDSVDGIVDTVDDVDKPDFESMTPIELRDWAIANGLGLKIKNIRNKEKLLEIVRG